MIQKIIHGQGERVAADGGSLVDQPVVQIMPPNLMEGTIYSRCQIMNLEKNNGITLPRYDTSEINDLSFLGARGSWVEEGGDIPKSKVQFDNKRLTLRKCAVNIPATNEILEDVDALIGYINFAGVNAIRYQVDRALIYGLNQFAAGGVVAGGSEATIFLPPEPTWAATAAKMIGSYYGGAEGIWVVSQNVWAELVLEHQSDFLLEMVGGRAYLFSYPIYVCKAANPDCMILGDFSQYMVVQRELRQDISEHTLFDTDQSQLRFVLRIQGAPVWNSPVTLEDGSIVAPFVALDGMEYEESSEEWEQSSSSSSSSSDSSESSDSSGPQP